MLALFACAGVVNAAEPLSVTNAVTKASDLVISSNDVILQTGDSLTAYGHKTGVQRLVPLALKALGIKPKWHIKAYGGRVSREVLEELPKDLEFKPSIVIIECGINDLKGVKGKVEYKEFTDNLENIWKLVEGCNARPVQVGLCQEREGQDKGWNENLRKLCSERTTPVLYCDVAAQMMPVWNDPSVPTVKNRPFTKQTTDGVHPNPFGYRQMAWAVLKTIGFKDEDRDKVYALWEQNVKN